MFQWNKLHKIESTHKNGQTNSNNSLATANELSVFSHFVGLVYKRLSMKFSFCKNTRLSV